ncbi:MAG TPA: tetratricopeptide repeat protein [Thermoguttaceae bacterium]|nr:tetratricopeptide repeat protein [Thermoguttaceae bacterium]
MNAPNRPSIRRFLLPALLLVVVMMAVFGQVAGHGFLAWDDEEHVLKNPRLNPVTWYGVWEFWAEPTEPFFGLYVPLSYTFFAAEAFLAGRPPSPAVFHFGSLLLHIACVLLVFVILRRLFRHEGAACVGALLFGLHPLQVESVAWISETRGLLCGALSLAAVWQYLCFTDATASRKSAAIHYAVATTAFVLALLAKPAAVAVPLILGALEAGLLGRRWRQVAAALVPWLVVAVGWTVLTKLGQPDQWLSFVPPLWARPLLAGDALAFYVQKLVAPLQCAPDYGRTPVRVIGQWPFYVAWLLPAVLLAALACVRYRRVWLTALAVFVAWLLPVLGLVPFVYQRISTVADRYAYLAMLGPALALSWYLSLRWNRWTVGISTAVLGVLGLMTIVQTGLWQDDVTLFEYALEVNEESVVANHNLGLARARQGRFFEAIDYYHRVLDVDDEHAESHLSLGLAFFRLRNFEMSEKHLRRALELRPEWGLVHFYLGSALRFGRNNLEGALQHFDAAIELQPTYFEARINRIEVLVAMQRYDEASDACRELLDMRLVSYDSEEARGIRNTLRSCREKATAGKPAR